MNTNTLKNTLKKAIPAGLPILIKGAPGIGKSDIITQVAREIGYELIITHPVISDPTDFKGLPGIVDGRAEFLPYGDLRSLMEAENDTICFLDDLGQAPPVVQAAAMQLLLARQINGKKISDKIVFIAATNRRQDRAGVSSILEPVKSRFASIIELEVDVENWVEWALKNNMPDEIIGFVYFRPELLNKPNPTNDIVNSPCPRTIAFAGKLINAGINDIETLSGAIGEGAATELAAFCRIYKNLPNITEIISDPDNAEIPTDPSTLYAVVGALVNKLNKNNAPNVCKYAMRIPADFSMLLMRDGSKTCPEIQSTKQFIQWATKHQDILL